MIHYIQELPFLKWKCGFQTQFIFHEAVHAYEGNISLGEGVTLFYGRRLFVEDAVSFATTEGSYSLCLADMHFQLFLDTNPERVH